MAAAIPTTTPSLSTPNDASTTTKLNTTDDASNSDSDSEDSDNLTSIFADPPGYTLPTPPPTIVPFALSDGRTLCARLVGHSPLEGHFVWNGCRAVVRYLEGKTSINTDTTSKESQGRLGATQIPLSGKNVLELGAGAGIPSLVCASLGARRVVMTDYPDVDLLANMHHNVDAAGDVLGHDTTERVRVRGYIWGRDVRPLLNLIDNDAEEGEYFNYHRPCPSPPPSLTKFDIIIMTDLLFRHCEHANLVLTLRHALRKTSTAAALVFFTSHRPWLRDQDLAFFDRARECGMLIEKVWEEHVATPLFSRKNELGELVGEDEEVGGWVVTWGPDHWEQ